MKGIPSMPKEHQSKGIISGKDEGGVFSGGADLWKTDPPPSKGIIDL
jgi:hypothetical protein